MNEEHGALVIISGPSGVGKSTVLEKVIKNFPKIWFSVSATTRQPRPNETDGMDYYFMSRETFEQMIQNNELLEYMEYAGNYYGTPRLPIEEHVADDYIVILDVDVRGKLNIRQRYDKGISVFITPPDMQELERRLRRRGTESEDAINKRLSMARHELDYKDGYDYIVINDVVERAARELTQIIHDAAAKQKCEE